jgi:lipopolysaccharide biosynthesis protein
MDLVVRDGDMDRGTPKRIIVVLGMHRSGTSAVTRGLKALGVELGDKLMPPVAGGNNDKGFWEDTEIVALNDEMLRSLGYDWQSQIPIDRLGAMQHALAGFELRAVQLLRSKMENVAVFGLKDPRIARLLPFWKSVFDHMGAQASYVIAVRHPLSVARSLNRRDGFSVEKSGYLWLGHVVPAMLDSEVGRRVVVDFDLLMERPKQQLSRIAEVLGLPFGETSPEVAEYIEEFLTEGLRHSQFHLDDLKLAVDLPQAVQDAYALLDKLAKDELSLSSAEAAKGFARISQHLRDAGPALRYMTRQDQEIASLKKNVTQRDQQLGAFNQTIAQRDQQIAALNQAVAERDAEMADLRQIVAGGEQQIRALAQESQQLLAGKDQEIHHLRLELAKTLRSRSWRVTGPLRKAAAPAWRTLSFAKRAQRKLLVKPLARRIRASTLFDADYYLGAHPDVRDAGLDPATHYVIHGWKEHRNPSAAFDTAGYLAANPDVAVAGLNPLVHYLKHGQKEGRVLESEKVSPPMAHIEIPEQITGMNVRFPAGLQMSSAHIAEAPCVNGDAGFRTVAFYLPQFHPAPANDLAWGEGFTEWRNVTRAQQEFTGHFQPRLPANYGFYDLRLEEIQVRQARDAKAAGIAAFCYYYYWFDGKTPLIKPLLTHKNNRDIDLPFCLCFANESWTKRWDGLDQEVIYQQTYGDDFAARFWRDALPFLKSEKYLRDQFGAPILLVYRPSIIPQFKQVAEDWRRLAKEAGFPGLKLIGSLAFEDYSKLSEGIDSFYEFPPLATYAQYKIGKLEPKSFVHGRTAASKTHVHDYRKWVMMERVVKESPPDIHPGIMPGWDNVARRPYQGNAFSDLEPRIFEEWAARASTRAARTADQLLFVNAWNEWAEGTYLEPDIRYGWAFLSALARGISSKRRVEVEKDSKPIAIFAHVHYPEIWQEICGLIERSVTVPFHLIITTSLDSDPAHPVTSQLREVEVHRVENRGRDVLPFLITLDRTRIDFDVAVKIHTKLSPHRVDGAEWRRMLTGDILPEDGCEPIVRLFREDPNLGFIGPAAHWALIREHIGSNSSAIEAITRRLGIDWNARDLDTGRFIAGSMFWFRKSALQTLSLAKLFDLFPGEMGQIDGTPAHAMERLFSLLGERVGFVTASTDQVDRLLRELKKGLYPLQSRVSLFSDQCVDAVNANRIALSRVDYLSGAGVARCAQSRLQVSRRQNLAHRWAANRHLKGAYLRLPRSLKSQIRNLLGFDT